jgi:hypothetical protein
MSLVPLICNLPVMGLRYPPPRGRMHLSRCLGAHLEMWEVVPSRGELLVFSTCSLRPKFPKHPELRRLVPYVRLSSLRHQKRKLSLKGKGKSLEVPGCDDCVLSAQSYSCQLAPSPRLELLTKVAVKGRSCLFCHRYATGIPELLPFFSALLGTFHVAPALPPGLPTIASVGKGVRLFSHRYATGFSELLLFPSRALSVPLE